MSLIVDWVNCGIFIKLNCHQLFKKNTTTGTHNNVVNLTNKKLNKRSQTQKGVLFDATYMKFTCRHNWVREVRLVLTPGER